MHLANYYTLDSMQSCNFIFAVYSLNRITETRVESAWAKNSRQGMNVKEVNLLQGRRD